MIITVTPVIGHYHVGHLTLPALQYRDINTGPITGYVSILPESRGFAVHVRCQGFFNVWGLCHDGYCRYKALESYPSLEAAKKAIEAALDSLESAKGGA